MPSRSSVGDLRMPIATASSPPAAGIAMLTVGGIAGIVIGLLFLLTPAQTELVCTRADGHVTCTQQVSRMLGSNDPIVVDLGPATAAHDRVKLSPYAGSRGNALTHARVELSGSPTHHVLVDGDIDRVSDAHNQLTRWLADSDEAPLRVESSGGFGERVVFPLLFAFAGIAALLWSQRLRRVARSS